MATTLELFQPSASTLLAMSSTSARVALAGSILSTQQRTLRLYNAGSVDAHLAFGDVTVVAVADGTGMVLPAGTVEYVKAPSPGIGYVAAILASGAPAGTLYVTTGEGC